MTVTAGQVIRKATSGSVIGCITILMLEYLHLFIILLHTILEIYLNLQQKQA